MINAFRNPRAALAVLATLCVFVASLWVLRDVLEQLRLHEVVEQLHALRPSALLWSAALAAGSYWALSLHDFCALRVIGKRLPYPAVALTSFIAYALSHSIGLSSLSGGSVRLRAYTSEGLSTTDIAVVQGLCTLTFLLGTGLMLGGSLILETREAAEILHLPLSLTWAIGALLMAVVTAYAALTALWRKPLTLRDWRFTLPGFGLTMAQIAVSCLDIAFAAGTLYVLLPDQAVASFPAFLGLYVIALNAGVLSNVPGGLGVFESVLLLLLRDVADEAMLGALLMYRVIYYFVPFVLALVLLAGRELLPHGLRALRATKWMRDWLESLIPQALAMAVFGAGSLLLISGALPAVGSRVDWLRDALPLGVLEISHLAGSAFGVGLLILARGLFRRLDGAWWLTQLLLAGGIAASLLKGIDYEEASVLLVLMGLLLLSRHRFYRRAPLLEGRLSPFWLLNIALVIAATVWLGFLVYRHVPYANDLWWQFAFDAGAPRMLRASLIAVLLGSAYGLWQLLGAIRPARATPSPEELDRAAACIRRHGDSVGNLALVGDKQLLFCEQNDAFLMYRQSGRSWVAMGDPVGNPARFPELLWRFRELCDEHDGWCVFYQVSTDRLPMYVDLGLALAKLGEEARVRLPEFSLEGPKRAELRTAFRKGGREGLSFAVLSGPEVAARLPELRAVSDNWLSRKAAAEKAFSVGRFDDAYLSRLPCGVVLREDRIVAFANIWPSGEKEELSVDLMRYSDAAPKGVMDYLFINLLLWGRDNGWRWFNLGMAPLSGLENHPLAPLWHKLGVLVHRYGEPLYNFDGLRRYKEKFHPEWRPRYLASPGGLVLPRVLMDITRLIAGGMREVVWK